MMDTQPIDAGRDMSLANAIDESIGLISAKYSDRWIVPAAAAEQAKLHWNDETSDRFEYVYESHSHSFMEIFVCLEGRCAVQLENDYYMLGPGDASIVFPDVPHNELPEKSRPYKALWLATDFHRVVAHIFYRDFNRHALLLEGDQFEIGFDYNFALHNMKQEWNGKGTSYAELMKTYIMQILLYSSRKMKEAPAGQRKENWRDTVVKQVWQYVEKNCDRHIRLSEISQELCVSINHLNNIFKAETGRTIPHYIDDYKIRKAKHMLRETTDTIQSIASRLGFYDQYHFSKIFKKETGSTPTQYRKSP